jgi:tripartite-type tricarboxylate transporter receptor subunit TctC
MNDLRKRNLFLSLAIVMGLGFSGCLSDKGFPDRPIVLICPWAAGGGTDRVARQTAALLEHELDVPVNVVNATGGGGITGHTRGALARPDGYTLTMVTVEINMLHWRGLTNISPQDFDPIGLVNCDAAALFVRNDAPWEDLTALQQHVREDPTGIKGSGTANGGIWHLAFAGWLDQLGVNPSDAIWLPNNGAAPSLQELIAGGVDVVCCSLPEAQSLLESSRVRCLGVMADERLSQYPDVPTLKEQGVDWTMTAWRGVCVPKGTPAAIEERLTEALKIVATGATFQNFMKNSGFEATWESGVEFRRYMQDVDDRLGNLLTSGALAFDQMWFGPRFFPGVIIALIAVVLVPLLASGGLRQVEAAESITFRGLVRIGEMVAWVVIYVLVADVVGFMVISAILLTYALWRMGNQVIVAVIVSLAVVPLAYQLFAVWLRVPLPQGWLGW